MNLPISTDALVCDLDGTLLHSEYEAVAVQGRTTSSFLSKNAALLLSKIGQIFPLIIATGRNGNSVKKLVSQLPDVKFKGFVLENGFVVQNNIVSFSQDREEQYKKDIDNNRIINNPKLEQFKEWDNIAKLFPDWERLPFYENCAGFVFNFDKTDIDRNMIDIKARYAEKVLNQNGYNHVVYKESRKIFIYKDNVNKMRGLALLGINPYIAIGDGLNDIEMLSQSTIPITLDSGVSQLKEIVKQKSGFCSLNKNHDAAYDMLYFAYKIIKEIN